MNYLKKAITELPGNLLFQTIIAIIFIIPAIEVIGQYISSGFMNSMESFPIIMLPGTKLSKFIPMPTWIQMLIMISTYIWGIVYLLRKNKLGIIAVTGFIGIQYVSSILGQIVNNITGWREMQGMSAPNNINRSLFSLWTNPLWEEIVFRGIPLLLLLVLKNKLSPKVYEFAVIIYFLLPTIMFSVYHVPNHGPSRIVDTFITGLILAYLAIKYSFLASLIIHYYLDANSIVRFMYIKGVPREQMAWSMKNGPLFKEIASICFSGLILIIPIVIMLNILKYKKTNSGWSKLSK